MLPCIGNNSYGKIVSGHIKAGKANAIYANRTLFNNQVGKLFGKTDPELPTAVKFRTVQTDAGSIYMPLYKMTIETAIEGQTTLQVDQAACLPLSQIGFAECLLYSRYLMVPIARTFNGQAYTIMTDTLVDLQLMTDGRGDAETKIGALLPDQRYPAHCFYYACEHGRKLVDICLYCLPAW